MAVPNTERRQSFRVEVIAPARFRLIEEKNTEPITDWIDGTIDDVSQGGLKITTRMPESQVDMLLNQYVIIEFSCKLPDIPNAISATASIVYFLRGTTEKKITTITIGLSFINIANTEKNIISDFIRQRINIPAYS